MEPKNWNEIEIYVFENKIRIEGQLVVNCWFCSKFTKIILELVLFGISPNFTYVLNNS